MIENTPNRLGPQPSPDRVKPIRDSEQIIAGQASHLIHVKALKILGQIQEKGLVDKENSGDRGFFRARTKPVERGVDQSLLEKGRNRSDRRDDAIRVSALSEPVVKPKMVRNGDRELVKSAADEITNGVDSLAFRRSNGKSRFVKRMLNYVNHGVAVPTAEQLALKRLRGQAQGDITFRERQILLDEAIDNGVRLLNLHHLVKSDESGQFNAPLIAELMMQDRSFFQKHSKILSQYRDIALRATEIDARNFQFVEPQWQHNLTFAQTAIQLNPDVFDFMGHGLKNNFELCMSAAMKRASNLQLIDSSLPHYDLIASACCLMDGRNLRFVDAQCKDYKKLALAMMKRDGRFLNWVSPEFRNDEEIVLTAIKNHSAAFSEAGDAIRERRAVALIAVKRWGSNLKYVGHKLQSDRNLVKVAVKNDFSALRYADQKLRDDWTFLPLLRLSHSFRSTKLFYLLRMIGLFRK